MKIKGKTISSILLIICSGLIIASLCAYATFEQLRDAVIVFMAIISLSFIVVIILINHYVDYLEISVESDKEQTK